MESGAALPSWVEPETVLPEQYLAAASRETPEHRLCLAVLEDAIRDLGRAPRGDRDTRRRDAWAWFASDDTAWPFSFVNIAAALGLYPDQLRRTHLERVKLGHRLNRHG